MKRVPSSRSHEYLEALEDERRKIQVFHRELPLCLELVNQAIESCRQQLSCSGRSDCEEQTQASGEGPVLEEFMPLKRSSPSESEEESNKCDENLGKKVDWLRSVQLWNQSTDLPPSKEDSPRKNSVIEAKKNGGAFHPFRKEKSATTTPATTTTTITTATPTRITVPVAAASSTADNGNKSREDKGQSNKKSRRCWSSELHRRFLQALQQLGGSHAATPKQIREFMNVDGLTNDEVKSHLQKYRLHTRRPAPHLQNNSNNSQSPQFLVVGGIWVPPPEYAPSKGEAQPQCTKGVYAPVAAPPPQLTLSSCTQQQKQISESDGHNNSCSGSPTPTSSSTDTTTASPAF